MKDYTVGVNELRDHYNQLRLFKKSIRTQVKMEYEAKIDFEIRSRTEAAELSFANHLAAVKERDDMPVRIIQDEVLRTRTWSIWERIRDLAGVQPEFTRAEDVREAKRLADIPYRWVESDNAFGYALVLTKAENGEKFDPTLSGVEDGVVIIRDIRVKDDEVSAWPGKPEHTAVWDEYWGGEPLAMKRYASKVANDHKGDVQR